MIAFSKTRCEKSTRAKCRFAVAFSTLLLGAGMLLQGCGSASGGTSGGTLDTVDTSGTSSLNLKMVDAPVSLNGREITAVNVGITAVSVVGERGNEVVATFDPPNVVNLLDLTPENPLVISDPSIPSGNYSQIRFQLDTASTTVVVDGATQPLLVPSGTTSGFNQNTSSENGDGQGRVGLRVNQPFTATPGGAVSFLLDFNAQQSIVSTGNGSFILKPVIVAVPEAEAGSVSGRVTNNNGDPVVNALVEARRNGVVLNSAPTDRNGNFVIQVLPAGTYDLVVQNAYTTLAGEALTAQGFDQAGGNTRPIPGTFPVRGGQRTSAGVVRD